MTRCIVFMVVCIFVRAEHACLAAGSTGALCKLQSETGFGLLAYSPG